jgi:hypothetical protein
MTDITYAGPDGEDEGPKRVAISSQDRFEAELLRVYGKFRLKYFKNKTQERRVRSVQKKLEGYMQWEYVTFWTQWAEKELGMGKYIGMDALLNCILDQGRYNAWLAKNGKPLDKEDTTTYGANFV